MLLRICVENLEWGFRSNVVPPPGSTLHLPCVVNDRELAISVKVTDVAFDFVTAVDRPTPDEEEVYVNCVFDPRTNQGDPVRSLKGVFAQSTEWPVSRAVPSA